MIGASRAVKPAWLSATRGWAILLCLVLGVSGCTLSVRKEAASSLTVTQPASPSALVVVVSSSMAAQSLGRLVATTARPDENIEVVHAGATAAVLAAAVAPAPATVAIPDRPAVPGGSATSFQSAEYRRSFAKWRGDVSEAREAVSVRTEAALGAWAGHLGIAAKVSRLPGPAQATDGLTGECAVAASTLAGLGQAAGARFGSRRVVLIYAPSLAGSPPAGELTGDDVIVVTPALSSAQAVSEAQASLLAAGAERASILGPESTATQLSQLVTLGLSQNVVSEALSGAALFANDSARLLPGATRELLPVIAPLLKTGASAVINGYASTTGTSQGNYLLSYARAASVAAFLEARGVPASCLSIVGHGASDLVASGPSGANRRVVVVIAEPENP
jgi:outer membrane protein OmpA-like peptidoglycan-associated protein